MVCAPLIQGALFFSGFFGVFSDSFGVPGPCRILPKQEHLLWSWHPRWEKSYGGFSAGGGFCNICKFVLKPHIAIASEVSISSKNSLQISRKENAASQLLRKPPFLEPPPPDSQPDACQTPLPQDFHNTLAHEHWERQLLGHRSKGIRFSVSTSAKVLWTRQRHERGYGAFQNFRKSAPLAPPSTLLGGKKNRMKNTYQRGQNYCKKNSLQKSSLEAIHLYLLQKHSAYGYKKARKLLQDKMSQGKDW